MATQKDVKNRINSVKNIRKITRAMEMVAAARLRRAEQRIDAMRPYAQSLRKATHQVASAVGQSAQPGLAAAAAREGRAGRGHPRHRRPRSRGLVQHPDHPRRAQPEEGDRRRGRGVRLLRGRPPRQLDAGFRGEQIAEAFTGFTDRPAFADARAIGAAGDRRLHRRGARPGRADLQPLRLAADPVRAPAHPAAAAGGGGLRRGHARSEEKPDDPELVEAHNRSDWVYEPEPEEALCGCSSTSTSTSRSSGRCSSRPPPSTARG